MTQEEFNKRTADFIADLQERVGELERRLNEPVNQSTPDGTQSPKP